MFLESIKLRDGLLFNIDRHQQRIKRTLSSYYQLEVESLKRPFNLKKCIEQEYLPYLKISKQQPLQDFKVRVVYNDRGVLDIEITPYNRAFIRGSITSFKLIDVGLNFDYSLKYEKRKIFSSFTDVLKPLKIEPLFVKDGCFTDCSFGNIAFRDKETNNWYSPSKPLLEGIQRDYLIAHNILVCKDITPKEIHNYDKIAIINALNNSLDTNSDAFLIFDITKTPII